MRLNKYILNLLLQHDCVIVPGFGGFVVHSEAAQIDEESGLCYPPRRSVGFNAGLTMNDGLLAQLYMQTLDASYPEALKMIEEDLGEVRAHLNSTGLYNFEGLGCIKQPAGGRYVFEPASQGGIAAPSLYGLNAMRLVPESAEVAEDKTVAVEVVGTGTQTESTDRRSVGREQEEMTAEDAVIAHKNCYVIYLPKRLVHGAAAVVAAIFIYFCFAPPVKEAGQSETKQIEAGSSLLSTYPVKQVTAEVRTNRSTSVAVVPTDTETETNETVTETPVVETAETETVKEQTFTPYYTIVLASGVKESNALSFISGLKKDGCEGLSILSRRGVRRVVYKRFETEGEAYAALRSMRRLTEQSSVKKAFQEGWVYKVRSEE